MKLTPIHYDYGIKILIDKDNILTNIPNPTYSCYNIKKQSKDDYTILVHDFFWNAGYIPKYLWRDELPFAKSMMGFIHDKYLRTIIEWYIGLINNWDSFFMAVELFGNLEKYIGNKLGYDYPFKLEEEMKEYFMSIRNQ